MPTSFQRMDFTESPEINITPTTLRLDGLSLTAAQRARIDSLLREDSVLKVIYQMQSRIRNGMRVTLEGTPLYDGKQWDSDHDFGFNIILPIAKATAEACGAVTQHVLLFDEYSNKSTSTVHERAAYNSFLKECSFLPCDRVVFESDMADYAFAIINILDQNGVVMRKENGNLVMRGSGQPLLQKPDGRYACPVLDAAFQYEKEGDLHLVVHPEDFAGQQEDMRSILIQRSWLQFLEAFPGQVQQIFSDYVAPNTAETNLYSASQSVENFTNEVLQSLRAQPTVRAEKLSVGMQFIFKYFLEQEKKYSRFIGVGKAVQVFQDSCSTFINRQWLNVYFKEMRLTRMSGLDASGKIWTTHLSSSIHT